jgi:hypothetical protein
MITLTPKETNILATLILCGLIFIGALAFSTDSAHSKYEESLHKKELEIVKYKTEADQILKENLKYKRALRDKDEAYEKLEQDNLKNTDLATRKIQELLKDKQKMKEVFIPYKDSTGVAIALVQFEGCKEENKIVIAQRELLKSKSQIQDSIIVNLEEVITLDRKVFTNYEDQIEIHKKYEKRLIRKNKFAKISTIVVGVIGLVGIIVTQ